MTPEERWKKIENLAQSALERDDAERTAYLDDACDDSGLRPEVEELVETYERVRRTKGTVLSGPSFVPKPAVELEPGQDLGPYRILDRIGEGGMATVYRASSGGGGTVAVKVAQPGFDTGRLTRQFQAEHHLLDRLSHPNIARLLDSGSLDDGRPYVVVEYVEGLPIHRYCEQRDLGVSDRLGLFRQVCGAVQYAHEKRVIHRDIKPTNVLVDRAGVPKLLDFGIALELESGGASPPCEGPMTPRYASPEQIRGEEITPRSDVYSLGVVLYELLAGRPPYGDGAHGPREMARILEECEPPPASAVARSEKLRRQIGVELDAIVMKAMARDPASRHASARALSEELKRGMGV